MKSKWGWAVYPVLVGLFILFTVKSVIDAKSFGWSQTRERQKRVAEEQQTVSRLEAKLAILRKLSEDEMEADLSELITAVPVSKQLFAAVAQVRMAATVSGIKLEKYSAQVGDIREATVSAQKANSDALQLAVLLNVFDLHQLREFLEVLERQLPVARVTEVEFGGKSGVRVTVKQGDSPWVKSGATVDQPLPDYQSKLLQVKNKLELYERLSQSNMAEAEEIGTASGNLGGSLF